ncbi:hypothetical protein PIB30_004567 [Stylosanthes scabra]|uniref:Uncharacterized protein n=1 Tax=Stylosanthes scabra TaxID=79078 RepID=A0ABU6Y104_9FABA|nr:hypothetical protein [Stylosanthes scabra]
MGAQKHAAMGSRERAIKGAWARDPSRDILESTKIQGADAPRPSRGCVGRADVPREGRERAMHLGSFGRMWASSPRGRAKAIDPRCHRVRPAVTRFPSTCAMLPWRTSYGQGTATVLAGV